MEILAASGLVLTPTASGKADHRLPILELHLHPQEGFGSRVIFGLSQEEIAWYHGG
jgi:hypothetical protein